MKKINYYVQLAFIVLMMLCLPIILVHESYRIVLVSTGVFLAMYQCVNSVIVFTKSYSALLRNKIKTYWTGLILLLPMSLLAIFVEHHFIYAAVIIFLVLIELQYLSICRRISFYKRDKALW